MLAQYLNRDEIALRINRNQQVEWRTFKAGNGRQIDRLENVGHRAAVRRQFAAQRPGRHLRQLGSDLERRWKAAGNFSLVKVAGLGKAAENERKPGENKCRQPTLFTA